MHVVRIGISGDRDELQKKNTLDVDGTSKTYKTDVEAVWSITAAAPSAPGAYEFMSVSSTYRRSHTLSARGSELEQVDAARA